MLKYITSLVGIFLCVYSFGQTYAYSFKGDVDADKATTIENRIMEMPDVVSCKVKVKADSGKGELIIVIDKGDKRGEADEQFKAKDVKGLLIGQGLEPIQFIQLKD